jgi:hypothetical protein
MLLALREAVWSHKSLLEADHVLGSPIKSDERTYVQLEAQCLIIRRAQS